MFLCKLFAELQELQRETVSVSIASPSHQQFMECIVPVATTALKDLASQLVSLVRADKVVESFPGETDLAFPAKPQQRTLAEGGFLFVLLPFG